MTRNPTRRVMDLLHRLQEFRCGHTAGTETGASEDDYGCHNDESTISGQIQFAKTIGTTPA